MTITINMPDTEPLVLQDCQDVTMQGQGTGHVRIECQTEDKRQWWIVSPESEIKLEP
jgi:hypothetical protein